MVFLFKLIVINPYWDLVQLKYTIKSGFVNRFFEIFRKNYKKSDTPFVLVWPIFFCEGLFRKPLCVAAFAAEGFGGAAAGEAVVDGFGAGGGEDIVKLRDEKIAEGEGIVIEGFAEAIASKCEVTAKSASGESIELDLNFTERQRAILLSGGLLNYTKKNSN